MQFKKLATSTTWGSLAELTILQQQTGATILATAQKNKASTTSGDDYADVMGSMSYIHKPNTVLMLDTPREMLTTVGKGSKGKTYPVCSVSFYKS